MSLPIWDDGQREIAISQARVNRDVSRAIREDLERAARPDVTAAFEAYVTARATTDALPDGRPGGAGELPGAGRRATARAPRRFSTCSTRQIRLTQSEADLVQARYAAPAGARRPRGDPGPPTLHEQGRAVRTHTASGAWSLARSTAGGGMAA